MIGYQISVPGSCSSTEANRMRRSLRNRIREMEQKGLTCCLEEREEGNRTIFCCFNRKLGKQRERGLRQNLGAAIAEYICDVDEPQMIRRIISRDYHYRNPEESKEIQRYAYYLLEDSDAEAEEPHLRRKDRMAKQISYYLLKNRFLAVDGYFLFRMKRYQQVLAKLVEHAVDEYRLDQEYQEFIQLLKYFVTVQRPKVSLVHVFHTQKRQFHLLSADGTPLQIKEADDSIQEMMDPGMSQEDRIVSNLLTASPERVVLHTGYPEENVIRTLLQIFEDRIVVCDGCSRCRSFHHFKEDL